MNWRHKARLRPRELAEAASVSLRTIRHKITTGEIESYLEDGCRFIPIGAARRFVREEEPGAVRTPGATPEIRRLADEILSDWETR